MRLKTSSENELQVLRMLRPRVCDRAFATARSKLEGMAMQSSYIQPSPGEWFNHLMVIETMIYTALKDTKILLTIKGLIIKKVASHRLESVQISFCIS